LAKVFDFFQIKIFTPSPIYLIFLSMKTNNFKDYIKKEIFSLLNNSKPIIQHHPHCACISKQETPYLQCLAKHENVYWKLYSREKMGVNINSIKLDRERRGA
jgi:hypothetical protein